MKSHLNLLARLSCLFAVLAAGLSPAADFELKKGEHIALIGNALAERMQHDGWLEALIQSRYPQHEIVIRNLGFSADELTIRQRVEGFGSQDQWLTKVQADVIFAFFGFNESFKGDEGVEKFKTDLANFITKTGAQKYNGNSSPRIVLFSPISFENLNNKDLPDGKEHNARLKAYTAAMEAVAKEKGVTFVDLFTPSAELYAKAKQPLTINGVHLTEAGNKALAEVLDSALFGKRAEPVKMESLEKLRQAILDKNFQFYARYRPTDDYNIFGGRSGLKYPNGPGGPQISNYDVLMREMEILEVTTANRDKCIWAAAQGKELKPDDSNTPAFIEVKTNKPGKQQDGSYDFLSGEAAIEKMKVAEGMKISLFASEEKFPELANPVQMAFDTKGRLWVAAWPNYPHWRPKTPMNDKLLILEDTDGDGKADKCTTFAGDLHDPTGFEFYNGGVLLAQAPDLMFLKDTDGDGKADIREHLLHGISSGDSHHAANSFALTPGGALYFGEGVFHMTQIESIYGPVRNQNACMWRFEPRTFRVERYAPYGFANPHGHVIDRWGQDFLHDGTGANPYHGTVISSHLDAGGHPGAPQVYQQRTRPCPGTEILSSRHFPEEYQGNLLVANVITFQGILRYKFAQEGSSFTATEAEAIVSSTDGNFRPSDIEMGPDGAIWFTDWHKPLIGHMQHHIRDPNRDKVHGRIYRITYNGRELLKPAKIAGEPIEKLLDLLKEPENRVRFRARVEISAQDTDKVLAAVQKWTEGLDKNDPNYEHNLLEALWQYEARNTVNMELLRRMLRCNEPMARAAATRVLSNMRHLIPETLYLLRAQAEDEHGLVRLEAVRACSFFRTAEAAEVALLALKRPMDKYLTYTFGETMKQLTPFWSAAVEKGEVLAKGNPAGAAYLLEKVSTPALLKMERNEGVNAALLSRPGVPEQNRIEALQAMAKQNNSNLLAEIFAAMERTEKAGGTHMAHILEDYSKLLLAQPAADLKASADRIKTLAVNAQGAGLRSAAYAAWMTAEGNDENVYAAASKSAAGLSDYLSSVALIHDEALRSSLYPHVRPLMFSLPDHLLGEQTASKGTGKGLQVSYYHAVPPNAAIESFKKMKAEKTGIATRFGIDVIPGVKHDAYALLFEGSLNVTAKGRYTFATTSDDGSRLYLDNKLVVDNDGNHGMDMKTKDIDLAPGPHSLVVTYFNSSGGEGLEVTWSGPNFKTKPIAGDSLGSASGATLQDEAIRAVTYIPGHEAEKFSDFAKLIGDPQRRGAAIAALRALPKQHWSAEQAPRVIDTILAYLTSLPGSERANPAAVDALNLGKALADLLPKEKAEPLKARLQTLNVDIVVIRPIPHQMLFDHKRFVVETGKPVEVVFDNTDVMPHNLVITEIGAVAEVGQMAEQMGQAGEAKGYIPETPKILWHTKLLLPGNSERLSFTAPKEPGDYPFVCTFPGHYLVMNGVMQVVKEKSASTVNEVTVHSDAPQRAFVKMWEMKDLEGDLAQLEKGRNLAKGKELFNAVGCVKCHTLKGQGGKIGPDLSEVTKKYKGKTLLLQILEPSVEINEQFKTWMFTLKDGKRVSGLIAKEDDTNVEVNTNPLAVDGIVKVAKAEINARKASPMSSMPTGLLVTCSKEEILDLLAYLEAGGADK